jgi:hypothetical protein
MDDHLSDYGRDQQEQEKEMFRKFITDFFYIDYDGIVCFGKNELDEIHKDMPEFCEMIKPYISEDWTKEK